MKKSTNVAKKVYQILHDKCDKEEKSWRDWDRALRVHGISSKSYEHFADGIEYMMGLVNSDQDLIVCDDPWIDVNEMHGNYGILEIPTNVAEKILVLGDLP
jgi:hypothetical protein